MVGELDSCLMIIVFWYGKVWLEVFSVLFVSLEIGLMYLWYCGGCCWMFFVVVLFFVCFNLGCVGESDGVV